jgi:hypothetical protein
MASVTFKARVSAIGGTSFTLTPIYEGGGIPVDGGVPVGDVDITSGITTVVVNSTGAPDTQTVRHTNQIVMVDLNFEN